MVILFVDCIVLRENKNQFLKNLRNIVSSAKNEKGCLKYKWFVNPDNDNNFIIYGEFDTEENFLLYGKSEIVQMIGTQLLPLINGKPSFKHIRGEVFEEG